MPESALVRDYRDRTRSYLRERLLPFWIERSPDPDAGGFLSYFDADGHPSGETDKTFLMQARLLYTMSHAHRAGLGGGRCAELAEMGARFLLDHYWDSQYGGWYWIADRQGRARVRAKIGYGQCFGMYAFGEYHLATGDRRGREAMEETWAVVARHMADEEHGGYREILERDWRPAPPGPGGGDRKSFDVHMHMMEALTTVYEITGAADHRSQLSELISLLTGPMLDAETGTGIQQFGLDFTPLPAIPLDVKWGRDEVPPEGATPIDITSYGHNVEFAWLLLVAADALGQPRDRYAEIVRRLCDHCARFGIDPQHGGVFTQGPRDGPPTDNTDKQFWQQAEVLVGMLDAWQLLDDPRYWAAFRSVYDFVFGHMVHPTGEWRALVDRRGGPRWPYLGDAWKISYHTVRSMIEVERRLTAVASAPRAG